MARFVARSAWDAFRLDLNYYSRNNDDDEFRDNVGFEFGGRTHDDAYLVNALNPSDEPVLGVLGHHLVEDSDGLAGGIVNAIFESSSSGTVSWFADGFSLSARALDHAARTASGADDRAMIRAMLSGDDIVSLSREDDRFAAGAGNDTVRAGSGHDIVYAGGGRDLVIGAGGRDRLSGGGDADILYGGNDNDFLSGNAGNDRLNGGRGRDGLIGGDGADVFIFDGRFGSDTIRDFDPDQHGERIDLGRVASITGYGDLRANHLDQRGGDVVIHADDGSSIRLKDLSVDDLSANDFIF